jgi:uncharacterized DUF497 family protein
LTLEVIVNTITNIKNQFNDVKNIINTAKHGISFANIDDLEWDSAITRQDDRVEYGETRLITYAPLDGRLYCLVWTPRDDVIRPISFCKANAKERRRYDKERN